MNAIYFPRIKTTPAELKAFNNLSETRKELCCPILELTRGIDKKIDVQVKRIRKQIGSNTPFIMDLTQDPTFQDSVIEKYQNNHSNSYEAWRKFLEKLELQNFIPCLVGSLKYLADFIGQIKYFDKYYNGNFAYRIPISLEDNIADLAVILSKVLLPNVTSSNNIYLLLDFKEIRQESIPEFIAKIEDIKYVIEHIQFAGKVIPMFSSYPQVPPPDSKKEYEFGWGNMPLEEFKVLNLLNNTSMQFSYSDYAFIQPVRSPSGGILWYPRIDFPTKDKCYWIRYYNKKQEFLPNGDRKIKTYPSNIEAYQNIAKRLVREDWYKPNRIDCWGSEQIENATNSSEDIGKSPQHWIAVRANIHMSRMIDYLLSTR